MTDALARVALAALVAIHALLAVWSIAGFVEMFFPETPWPPVSNPLLPQTIHFLQWSFVLATAAVFILGVAFRWPFLPVALAIGYAAMASLCAVETFGCLEHRFRYVAMALEYAAYILILLFLFRAGYVKRYLRAAAA